METRLPTYRIVIAWLVAGFFVSLLVKYWVGPSGPIDKVGSSIWALATVTYSIRLTAKWRVTHSKSGLT